MDWKEWREGRKLLNEDWEEIPFGDVVISDTYGWFNKFYDELLYNHPEEVKGYVCWLEKWDIEEGTVYGYQGIALYHPENCLVIADFHRSQLIVLDFNRAWSGYYWVKVWKEVFKTIAEKFGYQLFPFNLDAIIHYHGMKLCYYCSLEGEWELFYFK